MPILSLLLLPALHALEPRAAAFASAEAAYAARDLPRASELYASIPHGPGYPPPALVTARRGLVALSRADHAAARPLLQAALREAEAAGDAATEGTAHRYLGRLLDETGDPQAARGHQWEALALHEASGEVKEAVADLLAIAKVEYAASPDTAYRLYLDAAEKAAEVRDPRYEAMALQGAAAALVRFGEHDWADTLLDQAERTQRAMVPPPAAGLALTRLSRAAAARAVDDHERTLALARPLVDAPDLKLAQRRSARIFAANALADLGRLPEAREVLAPTLALAEPELRGEALVLAAQLARRSGDLASARDHLASLTPAEVTAPETRADLESERAALALAQGDETAAIRGYERAAAVYDGLRATTPADREAFYGARWRLEHHRALLGLYAARGRVEEAYALGRRMKAAALAERARLDANPAPGDDPSMPWGLRGSASEGPAEAPAPLSALRRALRPDEAVLDYYLTDKHLILLWISAENVAVAVHPEDPARLTADVDRFISRLAHRDGAWAGDAARLGDRLLGPVWTLARAQGIESLYVSPHGRLHALPFEALRVGGELAGDRFAVAHVPALDVLVRPPRPRSTGPALVVGDPDASLPAAASEARAVAALSGDAELLLRDDASRRAVSRGLPGAATIHLAAHARQSWDRRGAWLELADGALAAWEIRRLPLRADLVVLSACESSLAPVLPGDELPQALDRAFLHAGARAVVASRWAVDDRATSGLMRRFQSLRRRPDLTAGQALAQAMRALRRGEPDRHTGAVAVRTRGPGPGGPVEAPDWSHPYFWAAFKLTGDPR